MHSMSNTTTVFVSWNRTQPFERPTRFRPLQNSITWKSKIGRGVVSSSTTTTARPPKSLGHSYVNYHPRIRENKMSAETVNVFRSALDLCQELFVADGARSDEEDAVLQNLRELLE